MLIPEACLIFRNDSVFVDVVKHGKIETKQIQAGISDDINVEVVSGLSENDKIMNKK
jgi:hypothetical protein